MPEHVAHTLDPWYDHQSRILILGSLPSPQSRQAACYYGHPRNRFWPVLAALFDEPVPADPAARRAFALRHHIALWDVIAHCTINGASDASIRDAHPNDLRPLLAEAPIAAIFTTGRTATDLFRTLIAPNLDRTSQYLPSTSPANQGRWPLARLIDAYRIILPYVTD